MSAKTSRFLTLASSALALLIALALTIGQYPISAGDLIGAFRFAFGDESAAPDRLQEVWMVIAQIRLPRVLAAAIVGAALAVSGAILQGTFVNPLVSPGILGVLNGAGFGAALAMILGLGIFGVQSLAFIGGFAAVSIALLIAKAYGRGDKILMLVLGGVISSALFGALISLMKYIADPYDTLPSIVYWLMGSVSSARIEHIIFALPVMALAIGAAAPFGKRLDIMTLGDDEAKALGVSVAPTRLALIAIATLLSAISVMICGAIGWVGLVVPHIARFIVGANHIALIPASALIGAIFLLTADTISRALFIVEVPLGILTSLVGIPVFIFTLARAKRGV